MQDPHTEERAGGQYPRNGEIMLKQHAANAARGIYAAYSYGKAYGIRAAMRARGIIMSRASSNIRMHARAVQQPGNAAGPEERRHVQQ